MQLTVCRHAVIITAAVLCASEVLIAQPACDSTIALRETELVGAGSEYARTAELADTGRTTQRLARRLSSSVMRCSIGPWATGVSHVSEVAPGINPAVVSVNGILNRSFPEDRNNGAMWAGRGLSSEISAGVIFRFGALTAGALPVLTTQQNQSYRLLPPFIPSLSPYANGLYHTLDAPQRFGPGAYSTFNAGQSFIRLDIRSLSVGFSNENLWWGPGISNAILFTNTGPGFPHLFLSVRRPINIGIGTLTGETVWGKLSESKYFDTNPANDHRIVVGALIAIEPGWVRGLHIGLGRTFVMPWDSVSGRNLFPFYQPFWKEDLASPENPSGSSNDDQRVSLMARYVLPESHFEVYGEWAREDHSWDKADFIQEPEHSSAHLFGAQKLFMPGDRRWVRSYFELANLQLLRQNRPGLRGTSVFYTHGPQGHTQLGQLLGASIGPGGESQILGVDVLGPSGLFGAYLERVRRDEFSALGRAAWSTTWPPRHDVAVTLGLKTTRVIRAMRIDAEFARSKRYNRNFIRHEFNSRAQLRISWLPSRGRQRPLPPPNAPPPDPR